MLDLLAEEPRVLVRDLAAAGQLYRGLRDVLAHHLIFAWNRAGLPYMTQSVIAGAAKTA